MTIASFNGILKVLSLIMTGYEGQDCQTEYEESLFSKLSIAYVINSAAIPIFVGFTFSGFVNEIPIDQSWYEKRGVVEPSRGLPRSFSDLLLSSAHRYEKSGVVGQAWLLLIVSAFGKEVRLTDGLERTRACWPRPCTS